MLRRDFLKLMASSIALTVPLIGEEAVAGQKQRKALPMTQFRALTLTRNRDTLRLDIGQAEGYWAACHLLRDVLANQPAKAHPWLLHTAALIQALVARSHGLESLIITSGYRALKTNTQSGGAKHSFHMSNERGYFHAMDFHMKGVEVDTLARYALLVQQGGVGFYKNKNFVHIDVGPPRAWADV
jgi:uncharacterized protein YcbK (DUF882 family)